MAVFGTSSVLGPVLGGAFAGQDSLLGIDGWRWIFYLNVPIGLLALAVVSKRLSLPRRTSATRIDYVGAALLTATIVPVLLVAEKGREWGWGSGLTLGLSALTVVSLVLFVVRERAVGEAAILPLRVFRSRVFSLTSVTSLLVGAGMFGGLVVLPLYLQIVRGSSPTEAGLQLIPLMVGIFATSTVAGMIMIAHRPLQAAADVRHRADVRGAAAHVDPRRRHADPAGRCRTCCSWAPVSACRCRRWSSACRTRCRRRTWASRPRR